MQEIDKIYYFYEYDYKEAKIKAVRKLKKRKMK